MKIQELFDLSGKVAVVTGGGDGIGKSCCEILAAAGAMIVVGDINIEKARNVAVSIVANGGKAIAVKCDVTSDPDLVELINRAVVTFGTINILVNNAGMGGGGRENTFKIDSDYIERIYRINVFAPWRLCQLAVPLMGESGYGSIINITSVSSVNTEADMSIYASSKAAMNHLAANLAYDFGPYGVRINCVGPGATETGSLASVMTPQMRKKMLHHTPIKRLGNVSDISQAVLFFASPASSWINGQVLFVNGGGKQTLS